MCVVQCRPLSDTKQYNESKYRLLFRVENSPTELINSAHSLKKSSASSLILALLIRIHFNIIVSFTRINVAHKLQRTHFNSTSTCVYVCMVIYLTGYRRSPFICGTTLLSCLEASEFGPFQHKWPNYLCCMPLVLAWISDECSQINTVATRIKVWNCFDLSTIHAIYL